jgi:hypothetical protein
MSSESKPLKPIPEAGRKAAAVISALTLKMARPLFWHAGLRSGREPKGASAFILQFEKLHVGVTADHVVQFYLDDLANNPRTLCQLGARQIDLEQRLIARSSALDIATFRIGPGELETMGAVPIECPHKWPPPEPRVGDTLTLTGFLDEQRTRIALGHYEMEAWGGHGIIDAMSGREIVTVYDPPAVHAVDGVAKPPLGFNMSGCSGGPALTFKTINGLLRWFPVGLIYKGPSGKGEGEFASFDRIHIRRIHFLRPDGSIDEPNQGWLPG